MDMFGMARDEVRAVLDASGCRVLRVDESTLGGVDWVGFMYFAGD
jgi:hypothetical protein